LENNIEEINMFIDFDELVKRYNVNITGIIHVGAHLGEEIPAYRKYTGNIHVFEPIKKCFDQIPDDVKKYNFALGEKEEYLFFNLANNDQSSSLLKPKSHLEEHPHITFDKKIMIGVKTLDSFSIQDCNFLNMDVQGYEIHVLRGSQKTLEKINYIYTEVNTKELYKNCILQNDLEKYLFNLNYEKKWEHITPHGWGDAFYVKIK
jgi:FkbM family methyltransferase